METRARAADKDEPLFTISVVADMVKVHPQTLRIYERAGLVKPSRTDGNTRLYSERDIQQVRSILVLTRDLGVNLAGVEIILGMREAAREMQRNIEELTEFIQTFMAEEFEAWKSKRHESLVRTGSRKMVRRSVSK